jgi:hypothetical protein
LIPGGPAVGIGAIVPRFVETAQYGTMRKKMQLDAENLIFSQDQGSISQKH